MEHAAQARSIRWFYAATDADWDALFTEQLPRLYNFFRYRVGIRADAEDLTSITFEKAWRARHWSFWTNQPQDSIHLEDYWCGMS